VFGLQHTRWLRNPFAWAGTHVYGNMTTSEQNDVATVAGDADPAGIYDETWRVESDAVQSMNIRACGVTQEVDGLVEPIRFFLSAPLEFNATDERRGVRRCMYFDMTASPARWSSEGVRVVNESDDGIWCETTHLSSFTAVHGSFSFSIFVDILCPNTNVISAEGFGNVLKGTWWFEPAAIMLWILIILHATLVVKAVRAHSKNEKIATLNNQLSDDFDSHMGHILKTVKGCITCRCEHLFLPETWAIFLAKVLKEYIDPEDFEDEEFLGVTRRLAASKLWTMRSTGQRRYVEKSSSGHNRPNEWRTAEATLARKWGLTDEQGVRRYTQFEMYFWVTHPVLKLALPSKRNPMRKRMSKLLVTVFGSLAASALFYASGATPHDSNPYCRAGLPWASWRHLVRAALVAFASTWLVAGLARVLMAMSKSSGRVTRSLGATLVSVYMLVSIGYCILFTANVSIEDSCAWLVSAMFRFLMFWLLAPVVITVALMWLEKFLVGGKFEEQDKSMQAAQLALQAAREVEQAPDLEMLNSGLRVATEPPRSWPRPPRLAWQA